MNHHVRLFLKSRIRLATTAGAHERPPESPLSQQSRYVPGPFLLSSLPGWAAELLASDDTPNQGIELVWRRPDTQATYVLHVLQAGRLQLRTVLPTAAPDCRKLLEHAAEHRTLNLVFDIEGTTRALDFLVGFDPEAARVALAAPQVRTSEAVQEDEGELLLALARAAEVPSLVADREVSEAMVILAGATAPVRLGRLGKFSALMSAAPHRVGPLH